jgi:hypothetical protein
MKLFLFLFSLLLTMVTAQNSVRGLVDRQSVSAVVIPLIGIDFMPSLFISSHFALASSCRSATAMIPNARPIVIAAQEPARHRERVNGESVLLVLESRRGNQGAV